MEADFTQQLIEASRAHRSWRERLQWLRDRLTDPTFPPGPGPLAAVAVWLRLLATGELPCEEDGRHYRPNHHAEAALQIEAALARLGRGETAWVLRRIFPYLPSFGEEFRRSEPLTRIRDIAHRNDIPSELKREIKQRLQNKLHRCAGPEDLRTSAELLGRITAPGANYSGEFVREFRIFHEELLEFFNARALDDRLASLAGDSSPEVASSVTSFLQTRGSGNTDPQSPGLDQLLELLESGTALRRAFAGHLGEENPHRRSQMRLTDIGLEDHAFTLLSECANRLENAWGDPSSPPSGSPETWMALLRALRAALDHLRLSQIEPEECQPLLAELAAWSERLDAGDRLHLLRLRATLARARRLAETYTDRITTLFTPAVETLGRSLGVADHALRVFIEGDLRGHVVFQLSRLVDLGLRVSAQVLDLPPWEPIVVGTATGRLLRAADLARVEGQEGPLLLLLDQVDGDAEVPAGVAGIVLGHTLPHLSHLGVRARQARVPFAASSATANLDSLAALVGQWARLDVQPDGLTLEATDPAHAAKPNPPPVTVPEIVVMDGPPILPLEQARPETCGAKAATAGRLVELAAGSNGLVRAPRGLAIPFSVMHQALDADPEIRREYHALQERLDRTSPQERDALLGRLAELVSHLPVPREIATTVAATFEPGTRLAVRSSANGEDLEDLAGAGLYESVVNVLPDGVPSAVTRVWSSLWSRRAAVSRTQAGIAHGRIHMGVLIQELVIPELSFILHTINPLTNDGDEALVELAVGLGEALASSRLPGTPYRLACHRRTGAVHLLACASFSVALRPAEGGGTSQERLDYSQVPLSAHPEAAGYLGQRLARIAAFLEERLKKPQDVEGVCAGGEVWIVQARPQQGL